MRRRTRGVTSEIEVPTRNRLPIVSVGDDNMRVLVLDFSPVIAVNGCVILFPCLKRQRSLSPGDIRFAIALPLLCKQQFQECVRGQNRGRAARPDCHLRICGRPLPAPG